MCAVGSLFPDLYPAGRVDDLGAENTRLGRSHRTLRTDHCNKWRKVPQPLIMAL